MLVAQSCPTLCDPMDCSLPGSSIHVIFQARILEWVAISFSRGSSWPRDRTRVSCIAGRFFTTWATRETGSNYHMIQQSHFWVYTQKKWKRGLDQTFIHHVHNSIITTAKKWKQRRCPPVDKQVTKCGVPITSGHYSALKKEENSDIR